MVAPSPHPDLPQRHLLTALLELDADLPAVAARTRTPLDELTAWAHSGSVQPWLQAHRQFATIARELQDLRRSSRALDHLEELAKTTDNPIEKRRILTAILRGSTTILHARRAPKPVPEGGASPFDAFSGQLGEHTPGVSSGPARPHQAPAVHNVKSANPLDILKELEAAEDFLRAQSTAPPNQSTQPNPHTPTPPTPPRTPSMTTPPPLHPPTSAPTLLTPLYHQDAPVAKPRHPRRSAAHLLAAAGLPAP
ncbi:MAG TPA: hypothetical protein VD997_02520 [Phycisphaerales bacterium]|nr:hypothetical protein [Phycisphaerales bacterium]